MSDSYAESFAIEIEREKLCRYWRREWTGFACLPCFLVGMAVGFAIAFPKHQREFESAMEVVTSTAAGIGAGLAITALLVAGIHFLFLRRESRKAAEALHVSVEGPFLRIKEGTSHFHDRKLHFRAIIDYTYFDNSRMRACGIGGLMLTTMAGGPNSTIRIHGIKNALEVRDMLSEIDRMRENS